MITGYFPWQQAADSDDDFVLFIQHHRFRSLRLRVFTENIVQVSSFVLVVVMEVFLF